MGICQNANELAFHELQQEMERVRCRLHALVNGDVSLLLDREVYKISTELDRLVVNLIKKEKEAQLN